MIDFDIDPLTAVIVTEPVTVTADEFTLVELLDEPPPHDASVRTAAVASAPEASRNLRPCQTIANPPAIKSANHKNAAGGRWRGQKGGASELLEFVTVTAAVPGPVTLDGTEQVVFVKAEETVQLSPTVPEKPFSPEIVRVEVCALPPVIVTEVGLRDSWKLGAH